ncbi:site-2 protease family protein [Dysosmobacter sp.]|uniref:site-2 protease family protein n=1 Tax=Dysosmobacter sp. TaxID=2591382 RepID=UPI002A85ADEB|nr:site-2 protease family protein [Dysosmobacter sp.]MDY3282365.1 site-2 protease family protein [Dysosmobacter sp.]
MHYLQNLLSQLNLASMGEAATRMAGVFLCLTIHETSHGLAAFCLGDPTAKELHRLSLNPLRHIDWFGLAMMFFVGFGWAKPVPVDPRYFRKPKEGMAVTALAGPVSNILLAALLLLISKAIYLANPSSYAAYVIFNFLVDTSILSVGLGLFNLIPIPPLDGSKVLASFLPDSAYWKLMRYERFGMLLLIVLSLTGIGGYAIGRGISRVWLLLYDLIY